MGYVIGIDGGGTKTAFALADAAGEILSRTEEKSINYREHGFDDVENTLRIGTEKVLKAAGVTAADLDCVVIAAPCYGENHKGDLGLTAAADRVYPSVKHLVVNDAVVGYCGALSGRPGINVVSGTGTIAFGRDSSGKFARSGGWSEHFSDEGSCYWLGRSAMGLFCKESDGRVKRGALYELMKAKHPMEEDFEFIEIMEKEYLPSRTRTASLQILLLEAARAGDEAAVELYSRAVDEIVEMACGVRNQLCFIGHIEVTLTGGLTHAMDLIEDRLREKLKEEGMIWTKAERTPMEGAVILALSERD